MTEPLQQFGWKKSSYERPNDKWVCGQLCDGTPCQSGPTPKGKCPGFNAQADANSPRCQPKRSLRQKRRIAVASMVAVSLSVCLLLWKPTSTTVISPGSLTSHHSNLNHRCADCHTSATEDWTQTVFKSDTSIEDARLCLKCHQEIGPEPLLAHSSTTNALEEIFEQSVSSNNSSATFAMSSFLTNKDANKERACNVCHREHHGQLHDLTKFTNQQCQTCHSNQFHSFEEGHPEFQLTYGNQSSGINFNHASHFNRYFKDDAQRLMPAAQRSVSNYLNDCSSCHQRGPDENRILTRGFEQMCSTCHESGIQDQDFPGIPFLALPAKPEDEIGEWPQANASTVLQKPPGFMKMLFEPSSDSSSNLDLHWQIKEFLHNVSLSGQKALDDKLPEEWKPLGNMEPSIVPILLHAQQLWFPNLQIEMKQKEQGDVIKPQMTEQSSPQFPIESDIGGGWSIRPDDFSIRYRPIGHADPIIKLWLDETVKLWNQDSTISKNDPVFEMLELLANPTASGTIASQGPVSSGRCLSCHGIEKDETLNTWRISWESNPETSSNSSFTKFSHGPHLKILAEDNCSSCHHLNDQVDSLNAVRHSTIHEFLSEHQTQTPLASHGFHAIIKASCINCHNTTNRLDNCTQCHLYHARDGQH